MYCKNCGKEIADGTTFCVDCGTNMAEQPMTDWSNSYFDGKVIGLIGVNLGVFFGSLFSLGFAWPALWCFYLRWIYKHTVVGGYRLKFTGKGIQLFGKYLLWVFLSIITVGIFDLWLPIKYEKWKTSHVVIDKIA